jgi:Flp pilus assembly protein TadG
MLRRELFRSVERPSRVPSVSEFGRREDGSLTIFSLFIFLLILMIAGLGVDMARHERERVMIQNTLDTAVLAAGSLSSGSATEAEMETMFFDYVTRAGLDPSMFTVDPTITGSYSRTITAEADFQMDTIFMGLLGIDTVRGNVAGSAEERNSMLEIALVLDVSGSMSRDGKIEALRPAARDFVTEMLTRLGPQRVSISIVPYNHQVHVDDDLRARINWDSRSLSIPGASASYPGAISNYVTHNAASRCARFRDADFETTSLTEGNDVEGSAMFAGLLGYYEPAFEAYSQAAGWCSDVYSRVILYQNDERVLHDYIDTLQGEGWTAIDYGMNWGIGILDQDFAPIVQDMVNNNLLPPVMSGHPFAFTEPDVEKIIVLMTDGINTDHLDLADDFKSGPTRVWYSETLANGTEVNGYLVEMPGNASGQRWFVPGSPLSAADDTYLAEAALPADAVQWDYHRLYERFRPEDVPTFFFAPDPVAFAEHASAVVDVGSYAAADIRTRAICGQARAAGVDVYTIAFQAPPLSETLLQDCAGEPGRYFDVDGLNISGAFDAIALQLTQLRLTQ